MYFLWIFFFLFEFLNFKNQNHPPFLSRNRFRRGMFNLISPDCQLKIFFWDIFGRDFRIQEQFHFFMFQVEETQFTLKNNVANYKCIFQILGKILMQMFFLIKIRNPSFGIRYSSDWPNSIRHNLYRDRSFASPARHYLQKRRRWRAPPYNEDSEIICSLPILYGTRSRPS